MAECRPKNYPKLKNYKPSRFMLPTCHYDAAKADRAVTFIENLRHTKASGQASGSGCFLGRSRSFGMCSALWMKREPSVSHGLCRIGKKNGSQSLPLRGLVSAFCR